MSVITAHKPKEDKVLQVGSNKFELVDFRLYEHKPGAEQSEIEYTGVYGINIAKVREINRMSKLTRLPAAHECVEGVLELRDEAIPVINLARYLGYRNCLPKPSDNIIICEFNRFVTGFIVHEATRIRRISWEHILPPTKLSGKEGGCVTGMYKIEDETMLLILDFERIVSVINGDSSLLDRFEEEKSQNLWSSSTDESRCALVVDDSYTGRAQTEMLLSQIGFKVYTANDGVDALEFLEKLYYASKDDGRDIYDVLQIIVSDVEMPRMDGYAFAQRVRSDSRFSMFPIIMNTSLSGRSNLVQGKLIADDYVVKFNAEELRESAERLLKDLQTKLTKRAEFAAAKRS